MSLICIVYKMENVKDLLPLNSLNETGIELKIKSVN